MPRPRLIRIFSAFVVANFLPHLLWALPVIELPTGFVAPAMLVLLLVFGTVYLPLGLLAAFLVSLLYRPHPAVLVGAILMTCVYGVLAWLVRGSGPHQSSLSNLPSALRISGLSIIASFVAVLLQSVVLHSVPGGRPEIGFSFTMWARHAMVLLSLTPVVLVNLGRPLRNWAGLQPEGLSRLPLQVRHIAEACAYSVAMFALLVGTVWAREVKGLNILYLAGIPWLILAAHRGMAQTTISLFFGGVGASIVWTSLRGNTLFPAGQYPLLVFTSAVAALVLAAFVDERTEARNSLQNLVSQFRALASHTEAIREAERTRIARGVHDELGQCLTGLKMDLSVTARRLLAGQSPSALAENMFRAAASAGEIMTSVLRIGSDLRPGALDSVGLEAAVSWLASDMKKRSGIEWRVLRLDPVGANHQQATALFRILQEASTNIVRHAAASEVRINLVRTDSCIRLTVEDDGVGLPMRDTPERDPHFGILGMMERASALGGTVFVRPRADRGTEVCAEFPVASISRRI